MSPQADSFVLAMPAGWVDVELEPGAARQRFEDRLGAEAMAEIEVRRALLFLRRSLEQVRAQGVVYASALDEQPDPTDDYRIFAMCWLATRTADELGIPHVAPSLLREALRQPGDGRRRLGEPTTQVVDGAEVVREATVETLEGEGVTLDMLEVRYHSVIGDGEGLALLSLSTPNLDVAEDMIDLFDAIAGTLEFAAA